MPAKCPLEAAASSRRRLQSGVRPAAALVGDMDHGRPDKVQRVIRIGITAWRV